MAHAVHHIGNKTIPIGHKEKYYLQTTKWFANSMCKKRM